MDSDAHQLPPVPNQVQSLKPSLGPWTRFLLTHSIALPSRGLCHRFPSRKPLMAGLDFLAFQHPAGPAQSG